MCAELSSRSKIGWALDSLISSAAIVQQHFQWGQSCSGFMLIFPKNRELNLGFNRTTETKSFFRSFPGAFGHFSRTLLYIY